MDDDNDLARRQAALRALAQSQAQSQAQQSTQNQASSTDAAPASAGGAHNERRTTATRAQPRRLRAGAGALVSIAIIALVVVVGVNVVRARRSIAPSATSATHLATKPIVRLNPLGDGLVCASQVAWSPDSAQVAVLGDTQTCGPSSESAQTTGIFIYDARTGKLVQQLQPDTTLFGTVAVQEAIAKSESSPYNSPAVTYTKLVWTPDGKALLLPYSIETSGPKDTVATFVTGLMRLGLSQPSLTKVWLDSTHPQQSGVPERWDLTTGAPTTLPAPTVASAYRWTSNGSLAPGSAATDGAVEAPIGGQGFTIWQPGYLAYHVVPNADPTKPGSVWPTDILWQPEIMPLSPDGRYFYVYFSDQIATSISLTPPSQSVAPETSIAPRDKALLALAQQMTQASAPEPQAATLVAWRPDGKLLASVNFNIYGPQSATAGTFVVSLYDTATGSQVKQLAPDPPDVQSPNVARETLLWSPDGQRLLLEDNAHGAITIWGPGALPA